MKLNHLLITIITVITTTASMACVEPSSDDLTDFFAGTRQWTEVEDPNTFDIAETRPIFLDINFTNPGQSSAKWGSKSQKGRSVKICLTDDPNVLKVRRGLISLIVERHNSTVISARVLGDTYWFRPSARVGDRFLETLSDEDLLFFEEAWMGLD